MRMWHCRWGLALGGPVTLDRAIKNGGFLCDIQTLCFISLVEIGMQMFPDVFSIEAMYVIESLFPDIF